MYQRTEPCHCPRQHPAQERERTVHVALGKHGYIERVERHRMAFGHDETMLRSKLLDGRGSEVPQVSGYIVGSPVGSILAGIVRRTVRNCYQQHSLVCQQGVQSFPCLVQMLQMLQYVPKRDDVETSRRLVFQCVFRLYLQPEIRLGEFAGGGILLHSFYLPSQPLHRIGEIARTRTDV